MLREFEFIPLNLVSVSFLLTQNVCGDPYEWIVLISPYVKSCVHSNNQRAATVHYIKLSNSIA